MNADLAKRELIGLRVRVTGSGHKPYVGLEGVVVDETMRTLTLDTGAHEVLVPKDGQEFTFTLPDGSQAALVGRDLAHRPEDRTRRARGPRGHRKET